MVVAVTDREKILFAEGFGVLSVERPNVKVIPESLFRIASITKVVTGMTVLSLVEEGKLDLAAPVKEILPWLTLQNKETEENVTLNTCCPILPACLLSIRPKAHWRRAL